MSLNTIPTEILLLVLSHLLRPKDINSIARTNHQFYNIVNPYLYNNNVKRSKGLALIYGLRKSQLATVQNALQAGEDIQRVQNQHREPLLSYPAQSGNMEIFNLLLDSGADINAESKDKYTPLFRAAYSGHAEMVHTLLARGANPDPKDGLDRTPLFIASVMGHATVVEILLKTSQVNPNPQFRRTGETSLWTAARCGHVDIVRSLIAQGAIMQNRFQPTPNGNRLRRCSKEQKFLHKAVSKRRPEIIELLIHRNDVNPNGFYKNQTPLQLAVWKSREDMVELLLSDRRTNPDLTARESGRTPLLDALVMNNDKIAALLLAAGANPKIADRVWLSPAMLLEAPSAEARYQLVQQHSRNPRDLKWLDNSRNSSTSQSQTEQ